MKKRNTPTKNAVVAISTVAPLGAKVCGSPLHFAVTDSIKASAAAARDLFTQITGGDLTSAHPVYTSILTLHAADAHTAATLAEDLISLGKALLESSEQSFEAFWNRQQAANRLREAGDESLAELFRKLESHHVHIHSAYHDHIRDMLGPDRLLDLPSFFLQRDPACSEVLAFLSIFVPEIFYPLVVSTARTRLEILSLPVELLKPIDAFLHAYTPGRISHVEPFNIKSELCDLLEKANDALLRFLSSIRKSASVSRSAIKAQLKQAALGEEPLPESWANEAVAYAVVTDDRLKNEARKVAVAKSLVNTFTKKLVRVCCSDVATASELGRGLAAAKMTDHDKLALVGSVAPPYLNVHLNALFPHEILELTEKVAVGAAGIIGLNQTQKDALLEFLSLFESNPVARIDWAESDLEGQRSLELLDAHRQAICVARAARDSLSDARPVAVEITLSNGGVSISVNGETKTLRKAATRALIVFAILLAEGDGNFLAEDATKLYGYPPGNVAHDYDLMFKAVKNETDFSHIKTDDPLLGVRRIKGMTIRSNQPAAMLRMFLKDPSTRAKR